MTGTRFPLSPIKTIDEVVADPHVRERDMIIPVEYKGKSFEVFGNPIKMSLGTNEKGAQAPRSGESNEVVYEGWLGRSKKEISLLRENGVI